MVTVSLKPFNARHTEASKALGVFANRIDELRSEVSESHRKAIKHYDEIGEILRNWHRPATDTDCNSAVQLKPFEAWQNNAQKILAAFDRLLMEKKPADEISYSKCRDLLDVLSRLVGNWRMPAVVTPA